EFSAVPGTRGQRARVRSPARERGPARRRARGPRPLVRARRVPPQPRTHRRRRAVDLLRGSPHGQRPARHPPRRGARVQGPVPAVPDDAGVPRAAPRRLGLPRPARRARRREGARLHRQGRHRDLRHRRVQREVPRVRAAQRLGLRRHDRAHGLLGRPRRGVPDHGPALRRERVVVAQEDLRRRPARRGPPRHPLLPARRDAAVGPRGRARLRGRRRPLGLRPLPAHRRTLGRRGPAGVDDDALDAAVEHRRRRRPRHRLRPRDHRRRGRPGGRRGPPVGARRRGPGRDRHRPRHRRRPARQPLPPPAGPHRGRGLRGRWGREHSAPRRARRPRHHRRRHRPGAHGARLRRRGPPRGQGRGPRDGQPDRPRRALPARRAPGRRDVLQGRRPDAGRGAARPGRAVALRVLRALVSALLALPHAADLLRPALVVHPHHRGPRPAGRGERADQLVPAAHQARPLRGVAREQRRLGAVAQPLLGHAAADLAQRRGPVGDGVRRVAGRAGLVDGHRPRRPRPAPAVRRRGHVPGAQRHRHHAPRHRRHRRLV
ncbi:MAG: Isoleucyl-tRNA synthetase, partial [uncultured Actinomycetospora sp.]